MELTFEKKINRLNCVLGIKRHIRNIQNRKRQNKNEWLKAISISKIDILEDFKTLLREKNLKSTGILLRDLSGTTQWVSIAYYRYITSYVNVSKYRVPTVQTDEEKKILKALKKREALNFNDQTIFRAIYLDRVRKRQQPSYKATLDIKAPKNITIVLISGVFNEIFTTAAFERGVAHVCNRVNIDYIVPHVSGTKGHRNNCKIIHETLKKYIEENPRKKLWLIGYSKGGVDSLYYLRKQNVFAKKYIVGLSTIASPIMGTRHFNKRIVKTIKNTQISKEFFHLDSVKRDHWFKRNHNELPKNTFYTSIAFKTNWRDAHYSMMLSKIFLRIDAPNDGMVETSAAHFPDYFNNFNLGEIKGHHLAGARSSSYSQESLIEAMLIFLQTKNKLI